MAVLQNAWGKPPTNGQRWIAERPVRWVAIVVGAALIGGVAALTSGNGLVAGLALGVAIIGALFAWIGATLLRRRVADYDRRHGPDG